MERNKSDTESFSSCLGYLWSWFGSPAIDIDKWYSKLALQKTSSDLVKGLPTYSWDHSRKYRKESRTLRSWLGGERPHLLLGKKLVHSSPSSVQWQSFVWQRDIEWLDGHSLQGQTVFPGAGYVVMAMEAAIKLSGDQETRLLEVLDLHGSRPGRHIQEHGPLDARDSDAPKVTGARLLDERPSDPANPLDFFVMFSSFFMVSGNPGQAAYSAASAYTHALAPQWRPRGMAGSTIDIGAVFVALQK